MKEMMALVKENKKDTNNLNNKAKEKKTKRQEKQKKYRDAPVCKHCNRNTLTNRKVNAGNSNPMLTLVQPGGNQTKAPEGARGQQ
jgi:hypothetical protein